MGDILQMYTNEFELYKDKFYVASNPTYRTAIAINADPTAIAATEGCFSLFNTAVRTAATSSNPNTVIIPLYIKMYCTVAAASATDWSFRLALDVKERYSSGGTALTVKNTFVDTLTSFTAKTAKGEAYFGNLTLVAAGTESQVGNAKFHSATAGALVGDEYLITFGDWGGSSALLSASAAQSYHHANSPVFIGPGCSLIMQPFGTSAATTAAQFEVECSWIEARRGDSKPF